MLPVEVLFAILFGLVFGSFLNVCIVRLPRAESIAHPGSRCIHCQEPLRARDNIPLLSWLLLRGRSRCCGQPIPFHYPLVEVASALLATLCLLAFGVSLKALGMAIFCWLLLGLAVIDARTFLLPNALTLPGIVLGVAFAPFTLDGAGAWPGALAVSALSAFALGGGLFAIAWLYRILRHREGMGMGDIKLAAMLGAWLGWRLGLVALFVAIMAGAAGAIVAAVGASRRERGLGPARGATRIPFGAFLGAGAILTVFFGGPVLRWYCGFLR